MIFLVGSFSLELEDEEVVISLLREGADEYLRPVCLNLVLNALFVAEGG
tara:strand:- start:608 stop:754 length:147 start_codon:yes stop_codon:yes gene_type:complete